MHARWSIGDSVRVARNVRNDGTYPGVDTGTLLIRRGSVGTVIELGTFLQDQIIYSVHFLDFDRIVGCREEELVDPGELWIASNFEARERVAAGKVLALGPGQQVPRGAIGEILRVLRAESGIVYHMHFDCLPGRTLAVPESALITLAEAHHG